MTGRADGRTAEELGSAIAVELIAVLVAVADGRPKVMTIDDGLALPSGPFEVGIARCNRVCAPGWSGRRAAPRLRRAALHLRRSRPARRRQRGAGDLDQLSRPDPRRGRRGAARRLARLVRLFPLGGPSRRRAAPRRREARAGLTRVGRERQRRGEARDALAARRRRLRPRGRAMERRAGVAALRTLVRSEPRARGAS